MRRWTLILFALAGLFGAAGVGAAALAVHKPAGPDLQIAADFLLFHAGAVAAIAGATAEPRGGFLLSASILAAGTLVFCGDLAVRALADGRLFPMAAPIGGALLILGWLALSFASIRGLLSGNAA